uniref:Uncharacterized protein n=1 Tax=Cannabis sativa TaxID=3483 RepID=A0A803QUU2_CANSA
METRTGPLYHSRFCRKLLSSLKNDEEVHWFWINFLWAFILPWIMPKEREESFVARGSMLLLPVVKSSKPFLFGGCW